MQPNIIMKRPVPGLTAAALSRLMIDAARLLKLRHAITVLVTSNREIRALNSRFKGANHATDVLSFPAPEFARGFAGDIVISAEIASKNATQLGNSVAEEIKILALHGMLHLAGYDHESDSGQMAVKEMTLRKKLGLHSGLIERNAVESRPRGSRRRKTVRQPT